MKRLILPMVLVMSLSAVLTDIFLISKESLFQIFLKIFFKISQSWSVLSVLFLGTSEKYLGFFLGVLLLGLIGYVLYTNKLEKIEQISVQILSKRQTLERNPEL